MPSRRASRIVAGLPPSAPGMRIGLYGGSFDPAHEGHRRASLLALRRLRLDRIWWLVTPGNPLKDVAELPPLGPRMAAAAVLAADPRIVVSGAEEWLGTRFTADLIQALRRRAAGVRFVWIMGSDNLAQFHRWERWRSIARTVPIAIVNRPGYLAAALSSPAALAMRADRVDDADAASLADRRPPAWTFLVGPRVAASSSAIRSAASRS